MPIFLNEDNSNKVLSKKQIIIPQKLVDKLQTNMNLIGKNKNLKGFKRLNSILNKDYNKRSNRKDKIHTNDKTISFPDARRIDFDMRHMSQNPNNLEYQMLRW